MPTAAYAEVSWERMSNAVERVRQRLLRTTHTLENARVPYAVADDNAVAAWVACVDDAAVRNTQDVDILLRRTDLPAARKALEQAGFVYRRVASVDMFLDGPVAKARDAVHIVFAAEKVGRTMPRLPRMFPKRRRPKLSAYCHSTHWCG